MTTIQSPISSFSPLDELLLTISLPKPQEQTTRRAELTLGRDDVIAAMHKLLDHHRHVLLVAPRGMGKSHLLRYAARELVQDPNHLIVLDDFKALRGILRSIIHTLHQRGHLAYSKTLSLP